MTSTKKGSSNFSSFLKSSRMLHIQMAVAPLILGAVILYINNETIDFSFTQEPLEFIVPVVLVGVLLLGIGILVSLFPTKSGIEKSLNLSMEEQVYLNNPDKPFSDQED